MTITKGKVVKKGTDAKGRPRKFMEIRGLDYDEFEFGDILEYKKYEGTKQES